MKVRLFSTVLTLLLAVLFVPSTYGQSSADGSELDYVNMEINRVYKDLMSTLNPQQQGVLRREERAWIKWRDVEADRIARQTSKCCGDAYQASYINASVKLVKQRTEVLKNYHGASSSTADTVGLRGDKSQSSVNWKNMQYTLNCEGSKPFKVVVHNGKGKVYDKDAYIKSDPYYQVSIGAITNQQDLTGDGKPETAVLLYCSPPPSNFVYTFSEVQIFTEGPKLIAELNLEPLPAMPRAPQIDPHKFAIEGGKLVTGIRYYAEDESMASGQGPSIYRILTWRWNGRGFEIEKSSKVK